ncbi:hypothetical protein DFH06DRAFT_1219247 [Mycena polygramma]|nr:hypothetical protein DFH06DRAFT_1219247 [Mycena polygramma]
MQAVYSTATDVKIHKAIRHEWASFHAWLFEQHGRLEHRTYEIMSAAQRRWGKSNKADKQILAMQEELLVAARSEWLARVRNRQLHLEHWVMTPDEKQLLQQTLRWTPKEMVDAYHKEQVELGPMYQVVDPSTLGTKEPGEKSMNSPSRFRHPIVREDVPVPAYTNWASELAKMSAASPHKPARSLKSSLKSVELPSMPLYFVGALLQGSDLDAVAAEHLEAFALHISEEKIREYYADACEASVHFQRILSTVEPAQRDAVHDDFERRMRELASMKEREWKAIVVRELRHHQAAEMERRAALQLRAQQEAMMRRPPRKKEHHEFRDWDYLDEYNSPRRPHGSPLQFAYQSPRRQHASPGLHHGLPTIGAYQSPRRDYFEAYQSPHSQRDHLEAYRTPETDSTETYNSPPPRRRRRKPVVEEEDYAVSLPVDEFNPQLRRRNALHRLGGEGYALSPIMPLTTPVQYRAVPPKTGLWSVLTSWIANLG